MAVSLLSPPVTCPNSALLEDKWRIPPDAGPCRTLQLSDEGVHESHVSRAWELASRHGEEKEVLSIVKLYETIQI